jgi:fructose-1,6-bisphosphatase/inositol monophosphatase family enzyme
VISEAGIAVVERIIRRVAAEDIMPRWRNLKPSDVSEKQSGDPVTAADHAAEKRLGHELSAFLPDSLIVGEEAVAADPAILGSLEKPQPVWIIDPIDGTHNYIKGSPNFSTLVSLAHNGQILASWTFAPATGQIAIARAGFGARIGAEIASTAVSRSAPTLLEMAVATSRPEWWTPEQRRHMTTLESRGVRIEYMGPSGLEYLEVAAGRRTAILLYWEAVWDHAAGVLLCTEAGGAVTSADGKPFRLAGANQLPLVAAADRRTADMLHQAMAS